MTDNDQLDQNLKAMAGGFSDSDQKILAAQLARSARSTAACAAPAREPAQGPAGARRPSLLMYAEGYGEFALGREQFRTLPAELAGVRCADCSECTVHCANGVRVVERLSRAQEIFA